MKWAGIGGEGIAGEGIDDEGIVDGGIAGVVGGSEKVSVGIVKFSSRSRTYIASWAARERGMITKKV